jgi:import inner membrane translocase subunit TIM54
MSSNLFFFGVLLDTFTFLNLSFFLTVDREERTAFPSLINRANMADNMPPDKLSEQASTSGSSQNINAEVPKLPSPPRAIPPMLRPLKYMGVPETVLKWKPRLPSRNWSIFLTVTGTLTSLYVYDRKQCKKIRQDYKDKVQYLAEQPMQPNEYPRKIRVYCAKSPGDDDPDKSLLFFKKYVKPILVAAAIDYETMNGTRHGGLAREVRERIYSRRRQLLGIEPWGTPPSTSSSSEPDVLLQGILAYSRSPSEQLEDELNGAVVVVGRPAYKEWIHGLKTGWTSTLPPAKTDGIDDALAKELSEDSTFDEVQKDAANAIFSSDEPEEDGAGAPLPSKFSSSSPSLSYNPAFQAANGGATTTPQEAGPSVDPRLLEPPTNIPAQAPLLFVDYVNLTGFTNLPRRMFNFFYERERVRQGGEAGLSIAFGDKTNAREYDAPVDENGDVLRKSPPQGGDLDWGLESERFYPKRFSKTLTDIEKARKGFYEGLPRRLQDTRSYVRGERELTASEKHDIPKTESELREQRFNREREWRNLEQGFSILQPESGLEWHRAFIGSLRVLQQRRLDEQVDQNAA